MTYEIDYYSQTGNTKKLALGIAESLFAGDIRVVDLDSMQTVGDSDVHIVGFGLKKGVVPYQIMECLEELEGKTILFLVTCGMPPSEEYRESIERRLAPFMPDHCNYKGMFLCLGELPDEVTEKAQQAYTQAPDSNKAEQFLRFCRNARGHPDEQDIAEACTFIRAKLALS